MSGPEGRIGGAGTTRERITNSARVLFLAKGYAATTTREVAADAGVTERTLFNTVSNKSELLREVLLTYVFTDDRVPLLDRQDFAPTINAGTIDDFLSSYTLWVSTLHAKTSAVAEMTRAAAAVDAGAADIWTWGNTQQITDLHSLAKTLRWRGWLDPHISPIQTARSFAILSGHETYWRLVVDERWPRRRYRDWLRRHCAIELVQT